MRILFLGLICLFTSFDSFGVCTIDTLFPVTAQPNSSFELTIDGDWGKWCNQDTVLSVALFNSQGDTIWSESVYQVFVGNPGNYVIDSIKATFNIPISVTEGLFWDIGIKSFDYDQGKEHIIVVANVLPKGSSMAKICISNTSCTIGIDQYASKQIEAYPNPTSGLFQIDADQTELRDISGKLILNTTEKIIDLTNYPRGLYFIKALKGDKVYYSKVVYRTF